MATVSEGPGRTAESALPRVSVIVPVRDAAATLGDCLEALAEQDYPAELLEIIVVDNGCRDESPAVAARHGARVVAEPRGGSYAARNAGAAASGGSLLAFTDADAVPVRSWVRLLVEALLAGADVAGGPVLLRGGDPEGVAERYDRFRFLRQERYFREGYLVTANLAVRREAFMALGGFDARLRSGGDRDFGLRSRRAGHRWRYVEEAVVYHPPRSSARAILRKARRVGRGLGAQARRGGRWPWRALLAGALPLPLMVLRAAGRRALSGLPLRRKVALLLLDMGYRLRFLQGFLAGLRQGEPEP